MRVITKTRIEEAKEQHKESESALDGWYRLIKRNNFENFGGLREVFGSVDKVDKKYVFNIGGNKLRLIANINFKSQTIYIRYILTHKEYDKGKWKD